MGAGAIALVGHHYVARVVVPDTRLDDDLVHAVDYIASLARAIRVSSRQARVRASTNQPCFDHYV
jgi:hypothetical protein